MSQADIDRGLAIWCGGFAVLFGILSRIHRNPRKARP